MQKFINSSENQIIYQKHFQDAIDNKYLFKLEVLLDWILYIPSQKDIQALETLSKKLDNKITTFTPGTIEVSQLEKQKIQINNLIPLAQKNSHLSDKAQELFIAAVSRGQFNKASKLVPLVDPKDSLVVDYLKSVKNIFDNAHQELLLKSQNSNSTSKRSIDYFALPTLDTKTDSLIVQSFITQIENKQFLSAVENKNFSQLMKLRENDFVPIFSSDLYAEKIRFLSFDERSALCAIFEDTNSTIYNLGAPNTINHNPHIIDLSRQNRLEI